jgi:hypothetical protein
MPAFGRRTPPSVKVACEACGLMISTTASNVSREVIGWLVPRKGGGPNQVREQKPTGRYSHVACLKETVDPSIGHQEELF